MAHTGETETRIETLAAEMRALRWKRGKSGPEWAERFGLSPDRVKDLAAEASRRVRAEVLDPEAVGADVGSALSKVLADALEDDDRKSVIEAAKTWAMIAGANAPSRHELTGKNGAPLSRLPAATEAALVAAEAGDPAALRGLILQTAREWTDQLEPADLEAFIADRLRSMPPDARARALARLCAPELPAEAEPADAPALPPGSSN